MSTNNINTNNLNIKNLFFGSKLVEKVYCGTTLIYARDSDLFRFPLIFEPFASFGEYDQGQHMYPLVFDDDIIF